MLVDKSIGALEPERMQISTIFDNPNLLDREDLIRIRFNSEKNFVNEETGLSIAPGTELFVHMDL